MAEQTVEERAAQAEENKGRKAAAKLIGQGVKAYARGELSACQGYLDAGRLIDEGVQAQLALGDSREAAVKVADGKFAEETGDAVDVNRLIGCHHADRLLRDAGKIESPLHYSLYRDAFVRLCERTNKGGRDGERWILLPGLEGDCKALFATVAGLPVGGRANQAKDGAKDIVQRYASLQASAAKAAKDAADKAAQEAKVKAEAERAATAKAQEERAAAVEKAAQANRDAQATKDGEEKAAKLEALRKAQAEALAATKAHEEKEKAQRAADLQAASASKAAVKAADASKAAVKAADKAAGIIISASKPAESSKGANLLATAAAATVKDAAQMAYDMIAGHKTSDDVAQALMGLIADSKVLSATVKDAALMAVRHIAKAADEARKAAAPPTRKAS